jgi:hypothetical protein
VKSSPWSFVLGPFSSILHVLGVGSLPLRASQPGGSHRWRFRTVQTRGRTNSSKLKIQNIQSLKLNPRRRWLPAVYGYRGATNPKSKIQNSKLVLGVTSSLILMLMGCAAQGPPHPPRVQVPQRIRDLAVHQVGRSLELGFTPPTLATDGESLTKPLEVELFREITPPRTAASQATGTDPNSASPSSTPANPWVMLDAADLTRLARGQKVVYADRLSEQKFASSVGSIFSFKARALTRGFRGRAILGEISNRAAATLLDVSGPVQNLKVVTTERALRLGWEAPTHNLTGAPASHLTGYRVYRSEKPKLESFNAVGESKEPAFPDPHFEFGRTYRYKVRTLFKQGDQQAEGEDSQPYEVTPRDVFPPAAPQGLTALYTVGAVELVWTANTEPDLGGYTVYRREEGKPFRPINKELLRVPIYRDSSIEPQRHYFYEVTAVDLSGNESKPSTEVQAVTE